MNRDTGLRLTEAGQCGSRPGERRPAQGLWLRWAPAVRARTHEGCVDFQLLSETRARVARSLGMKSKFRGAWSP